MGSRTAPYLKLNPTKVHVATTYEVPIVHAFRELRELAAASGRAEAIPRHPEFQNNLILTEMERGNGVEAAAKKAQDLAIVEAEPSFEVDSWDGTVKVSALATVLTLAPAASAGVGRPYKLVCQVERISDRTVVGSVKPEQAANDEPLAGCDAAISIIIFQMDVIHRLTLSEIHPDAVTMAYGPLADFITIVREQTSG